MNDPRSRAREIARAAAERNEPLSWFEEFYADAERDSRRIPWADLTPNPNLIEWLDREKTSGGRKRALVIGCGLGDDAEELARRGFQVTAFDISTTAIQWARIRFPRTPVDYLQCNLLDPPAVWELAFDFVFEAYTLQVLPPDLRPQATAAIARFVSPQGRLLVISRAREQDDPVGSLPWPLTRFELGAFSAAGLREIRFEDYQESEDPPVRRFRAEYRRP